jgi:hypothetical protein
MLFPIPLAVRGNCRDAGGLFAFWAANNTLYHCPLTSSSASAVWILPFDEAESGACLFDVLNLSSGCIRHFIRRAESTPICQRDQISWAWIRRSRRQTADSHFTDPFSTRCLVHVPLAPLWRLHPSRSTVRRASNQRTFYSRFPFPFEISHYPLKRTKGNSMPCRLSHSTREQQI